jgi:hypothetical protein
MANNNITGSENIHVKVDQNNLIYIDPNTVISPDGSLSPRGVKHEELTMYVNLEADLVPRSILVSDNDTNTLKFVAGGKLSFLNNKNNVEGVETKDYDTSWTDAFAPSSLISNNNHTTYDASAQSFGIEHVDISIKGYNAIPQVSMQFIDVRGKTLFEAAEDSPYAAFFHVPWPIFYLTIKGYYGKAIKYRLHLVSFKTKYNDTNGNFESAAVFVGSTYAWLSDIPLQGILNAAYMFPIESSKTNTNDGTKSQETVVKSTRGFSYLKTIFSEYKKSGHISANFPVKTLREVITAASTLDKILEQKIFSEVVDMRLFTGIKEFGETLDEFRQAITGWANLYLDKAAGVALTSNNIDYYYLSDSDKFNTKNVIGLKTPGTLQNLITSYSEKLSKNDIFVTNLINQTQAVFKKRSFGLGDISKFEWNSQTEQNNFFQLEPSDDPNLQKQQDAGEIVGKVLIGIDYLVGLIDDISNLFEEQRILFENDVEVAMNEYVKRSDTGLGFEPTIKNLFVIVLANAEAFIRLMQDTHARAIEVASERRLFVDKYTNENSKADIIYPWPEIKKRNEKDKQNVLVYPGDPSISKTLFADNAKLWPEVDFVENFIGVATNKIDSLAPKEGGVGKIVYSFNNNEDQKNIQKVSVGDLLSTIVPYSSKIHSDFVYEIWERALNYTFVDSFDDETIKELADKEYKNILSSIQYDEDLIKLVKENFLSQNTFRDLLYKLAPYDKYFYYLSQQPTTNYLQGLYDNPITILQYRDNKTDFGNSLKYSRLQNYLSNYKPEAYRQNIFPYSSQAYNNYFETKNSRTFSNTDLEFNGFINVNTNIGFICGKIDPQFWINKYYSTNIFLQKLNLNGKYTHILNTPYFHKQLFSDFVANTARGKYAGSAYLLLNSIPFVDLEDNVKYSGENFLVSSLFREISSTQSIPYHLMLKWGSLYHRYKIYKTTGNDILKGFLTGGITTPIDGNTFFDNNSGFTYTNGSVTGITYTGATHIGVHPFYDAIFHQVVNDYEPFNFISGNTEYSINTNNGNILTYSFASPNGRTYWTSYVDNSKYDTADYRYTILPSNGINTQVDKIIYDTTTANQKGQLANNVLLDTERNFDDDTQNNFRLFWEEEIFVQSFSGATFSTPSEYNRIYDRYNIYDNEFGLNKSLRKVYDLISTFSPTILDEFEYYFLEFASQRNSTTSTNPPFNSVYYYNFQDFLKEIVSVNKSKITATTITDQINQIINLQNQKLKTISSNILSKNNLINITFGNPKELNPHIFHGFAQIDNFNILTYNPYVDNTNQYLIDLYVGEEPQTDCYLNFFKDFNIEITDQNVKDFRPLVLIYAGYRNAYSGNTADLFRNYIKTNIFVKDNDSNSSAKGSAERLSLYLTTLVNSLYKNVKPQSSANKINITSGYNDSPLKLELYNHFKSFNDKWTGGNSIGQRNLIDEFLFLDKANRDIGQQYFLNLDRITSLEDEGNAKQSLYGVISLLLQQTGFDMKALPAYVNFYGTSVSPTPKLIPSKNVASNLFGTFTDVDFQESSPKIIIQYVQNLSKRLDMPKPNKKYKFNDDSFDISNVNNNPVIYELPKVFSTADLVKSNRVVAFELSFGDQNQNIFKTIQLDQATLKNTTESFVVLENLARSESGSSSYNVDVSLYDYYRQAAYSCEVTCLGNVMIQPTMYFYLKNVPMFKGTYWITEVSHSIRNNNIVTTFKGARMPYTQLPDPKDSFMSSYRTMFDKMTQNAISRIYGSDKNTVQTLQFVRTSTGVYTVDTGKSTLDSENVKLVNESGYQMGIPYNGQDGERYISYIELLTPHGTYGKGDKFLRGYVAQMGGLFNTYNPTDDMTLLSNLDTTTLGQTFNPAKVQFQELRTIEEKNFFYSCRFNTKETNANKIIKAKTTFLNPKDNSTYSYNHTYQLDASNNQTRSFNGPVDIGPKATDGNYAVGMSVALMKKLALNPGDVVYFKVE